MSFSHLFKLCFQILAVSSNLGQVPPLFTGLLSGHFPDSGIVAVTLGIGNKTYKGLCVCVLEQQAWPI